MSSASQSDRLAGVSLTQVTVWTIGHSTRAQQELIGLLKSHDIQTLADIRRFPGSRRFSHFNRDVLPEGLAKAGIEYRWFEALGGRRNPRRDSPHTVWRNTSFRGYADYMQTEEFRAAARALVELAESTRTAMMCSEANWWRCHRSMVADYLTALGHPVIHIESKKRLVNHPLTAPARIQNGQLSYPDDDDPGGGGDDEATGSTKKGSRQKRGKAG